MEILWGSQKVVRKVVQRVWRLVGRMVVHLVEHSVGPKDEKMAAWLAEKLGQWTDGYWVCWKVVPRDMH